MIMTKRNHFAIACSEVDCINRKKQVEKINRERTGREI